MIAYTSTHTLLPGVAIELDWENSLDSDDAKDWDWGEIRAFVNGVSVPFCGSLIDDMLCAEYERVGVNAFGLRDRMLRQLEGAAESAAEVNVDDHLVYTRGGPVYQVGQAQIVDRQVAANELRKAGAR